MWQNILASVLAIVARATWRQMQQVAGAFLILCGLVFQSVAATVLGFAILIWTMRGSDDADS